MKRLIDKEPRHPLFQNAGVLFACLGTLPAQV